LNVDTLLSDDIKNRIIKPLEIDDTRSAQSLFYSSTSC
jgi:hypothetical protein